MKVSIFGIGYVGAVSAACLARDGHTVVAVDVSAAKVDDLNAGRSPIVEPRLAELIAASTAAGRLRATLSLDRAVDETDISLVCVGTPARADGSLDTRFAEKVAAELGRALAGKGAFHSVVFRSTVAPGTVEATLIPLLELASGKRAGEGFGVAYHPEFLREGSAIEDYDAPGAIVFGRLDDITIDRLTALQPVHGVPPNIVSIREAEAIKLASNAWHALKVSFANEIGNVCAASAIDSHVVMDALCADVRLNISPAYLRPGFAYGGSCLPKDLTALRAHARAVGVDTPVLDATHAANDAQIERALRMVEAAGGARVALIGLSFKPDTDDLRESPVVILAERLIGRGRRVRIFDPNIRLSRLTGANLAYVANALPHLSTLLCETLEDALADAEALVLAHRAEGRRALESAGGRPVVDLVRVRPDLRSGDGYWGLSW